MASHAPTQPRPAESLSYEEAFLELRNTVQAIESGTQPLDDSLRAFQRGTELLKRCQSVLASAEQRVRELTASELSGSEGSGN
ncbi:MAG: exodeoxyribonuclease VII small subunit [Planctomycetota bacterium]|nr:exodeoxyribonuclease VII small subunit [Planctomycetota bacterium]MDA1105070.1 exodeoxyribonuclease VII small subunit [Planctomycetota bacterium]